MSATDWNSEEEAVARQAFDLGKQRSIVILIDNLKDLSTKLDTPESIWHCLLYTSPSPRDGLLSRMPSSA